VSVRTTRSWGAAELLLGTLGAYAPRHSLLEVRYRVEGERLSRFFVGIHAGSAARIVTLIGQRTDVYVGCAPRVRRSGGREDIASSALLWADCDGEHVVSALRAFPLRPSIVLRSGTATHAHAFWALTAALRLPELEDANRRLALALGADPTCVDGARILRVPGTFNFKSHPPRPVRLLRYSPARYRPADILAALPAAPAAPAVSDVGPAQSPRRASDPLLGIEPADYVRVLIGREVGRDHKIACPFHSDQTPSFHVYPTAERGWTCFGCRTSTGRPLGGDIYRLASLLWSIPTSGRDFLALRDRLDHTFGVRRG
jgi:hypothetical protein